VAALGKGDPIRIVLSLPDETFYGEGEWVLGVKIQTGKYRYQFILSGGSSLKQLKSLLFPCGFS
jgi:hypothetical protein